MVWGQEINPKNLSFDWQSWMTFDLRPLSSAVRRQWKNCPKDSEELDVRLCGKPSFIEISRFSLLDWGEKSELPENILKNFTSAKEDEIFNIV